MNGLTPVSITMTKGKWLDVILSICETSAHHVESKHFFTAYEERMIASEIYSAIGDDVSANVWKELATYCLKAGQKLNASTENKENEQ